MNDENIIEELSHALNIKLSRIKTYVWNKPGYTLSSDSRVDTLNLHSLKIRKLPSCIKELSNLRILHLVGNELTSVHVVSGLNKLKILVLQANKINNLRALQKLTSLEELYLAHNPIRELTHLLNLKNLQKLSLHDTEVRDATLLKLLPNLQILSLGNEEIEKPHFLIDCHNLRVLTISGVFVQSTLNTEVYSCLKQMSLTTLRISYFKDISLDELNKLANLETLSVTLCNLTNVTSISKMKKLKRLDLSYNDIEDISDISKLKQLESINLSDNKIKDITPLRNLNNLISVNISSNIITDIEPLLNFQMKFTYRTRRYDSIEKEILIKNCEEITNPPIEVVKQGHKAIKEYFEQRKKSGEETLNEAKLILLGDGRSGKTSLANRLLNKDLPKEADRTQGIDIVIGAYSFPLTNGKDFKINIWDFAGQEKYKTLHQLFYTDSSLYVMVAESGNLTTDFDDWFQTAALFGEGSPLMLILNEFKSGIGVGSFDSSYWKKQFPEILKEVFTVNLQTKQNFSTVEDYIQLLVQTLPHTKYIFPSNWAAIRRILNSRRNEQYITLKDYLKVCEDNGILEKENALILSSVLHKVGDCLHYQKSDLLKQFIILKNEWATEAVYKILEDSIVAETKCGFFDLLDLERIWDNVEYEDMRPQLLELMKQFKLAYQLPGKDEYVTPPLLPSAKPMNFNWPDMNSLELYIEYEFLPKALLTQFIVTRHADIAQERTLVWRHGVVLKWHNEALAEVSKTKLQGRDAFYIRAQGANRKGLMTVILKTFRELHENYKGIRYKEKVPCICEGCANRKNIQHYYDFNNLTFRLQKGRYEVECNNSLQSINVMELLENTFVLENVRTGLEIQLKQNIARKSSTEIQIVKIFLASSNELKNEREEIEKAVGRKNKTLRKRGFLIELSIWEDNKFIGKSLRSQENYNREIEQCDLFAMIFFSKVGRYSLEEYELAYSLFENESMPRICIFQKNIDLPKMQKKLDADSRFEFLERLKKIEHFPLLFENTDKLVRELEAVIDKLLEDESFVSNLRNA